MRLILSTVFFLACFTAFSQQKKYTIPPEATEVWQPVPPVVTPGINNAPPSDAIVLFDGSELDAWESVNGGSANWVVEDGIFTVKPGTGDIRTRRAFGSLQLHLEFRTPSKIEGEGQGRGNSGVFFQERYEVQILDCYNNKTYPNGQVGSVYKQHIPLANPSKAPGEWQVYDIIFDAPVFNDEGMKVRSGYLTVILNGVLLQNHVEIKGTTEYIGWPKNFAHGKAPLKLQDHDNPMSFRNIWVREL